MKLHYQLTKLVLIIATSSASGCKLKTSSSAPQSSPANAAPKSLKQIDVTLINNEGSAFTVKGVCEKENLSWNLSTDEITYSACGSNSKRHTDAVLKNKILKQFSTFSLKANASANVGNCSAAFEQHLHLTYSDGRVEDAVYLNEGPFVCTKVPSALVANLSVYNTLLEAMQLGDLLE